MNKLFFIAFQIIIVTFSLSARAQAPSSFESANLFFESANQPISSKDLETYALRSDLNNTFNCSLNNANFKCGTERMSYEVDEVVQGILKNGGVFKKYNCSFFISPDMAKDYRYDRWKNVRSLASPAFVTPQQFNLVFKLNLETPFKPNSEQKILLEQGLVFSGNFRPTLFNLFDYTYFIKSDFKEENREFRFYLGPNSENLYSDLGSDIKSTYRKKNNMLIEKIELDSYTVPKLAGFSVCIPSPKTTYYCYTYGMTSKAQGNLLVKGESLEVAKSNMAYELDNDFYNEQKDLKKMLVENAKCSKNLDHLNLQLSVYSNDSNRNFFAPISKMKIW